METTKPRSEAQHRALFKYFRELAAELQAAGVDQKLFVQSLQEWEVPITEEFLHHIWKIFQEHMFLTSSTKQLKSHQVAQVYDAVNFFVSNKFGVSTPFPSEEELIHMQKNES